MSSSHVWDTSTGVPGMLKHTVTGRYYSRIQVGGKRTMKSLKTRVWSIAKLRHHDKLAQAERQRQKSVRLLEGRGLMGDLLEKHRADYLANTSFSQSAKTGLRNNIDRLRTNWGKCFGSAIDRLTPSQMTEDKVRRFANYLHAEAVFRKHNVPGQRKGYGAVTVNKTIELLHHVLRVGVATGAVGFLPFDLDPAVGGPIRKAERRRKIHLPPSDKMQEVFAQMRVIDYTPPDDRPEFREYLRDRAQESADFAEFLAYSGARQREAAAFVWEDDMRHSVILRGTKSVASADREVPKIAALRDLLQRMRKRREEVGRKLKGKVFTIKQCRQALETACRKVGAERLTHHSLRHFFATLCIESGVDIPTVSRWLGHADGGVLAMQTYGHLRAEHSAAAAAKVRLVARTPRSARGGGGATGPAGPASRPCAVRSNGPT